MMGSVAQLWTDRLLLRQWRESDLPLFAELNADPEVMRYFPAALSRSESDELAGRIRATIEQQGWGLWAVEVREVAPFIGFVGLNQVRFQAHFTPAIEVGWRLDRRHWGHGYATQAANAALEFAFGQLDCCQVVSFTADSNQRSAAVMQRLGMTRDPAGDFDHPAVADERLRRHVLYRISHADWLALDQGAGSWRVC
jgi:RimJ/RimL family protein N-acetyltransferase